MVCVWAADTLLVGPAGTTLDMHQLACTVAEPWP